MKMRKHEQRTDRDSPADDCGKPEGAKLSKVAQEAQAFLAAADAAIQRALSNDSKAFLDASRQEGGQ